MVEVFRVNGWRVNYTGASDKYEITNVDHSEYEAIWSAQEQECKFPTGLRFKVPKTIVNFMISQDLQRFLTPDTLSLSDRTFGVEFECYHPNKSEVQIRSEVVCELRNIGIVCKDSEYCHTVMRSWKIVSDSSIRGGAGIEVVSPILKGESGLEEIKKVLEVLNNLGCRVNKSTGTHVHHGASDLSTEALHKIFDLYSQNEEYFDSLVAHSRRADNGMYCHSLIGCVDNGSFPYDRYFKVNYKSYVKYGTIEFRQHQGTLNYDKISHWILLTQRVVERSKNYHRCFGSMDYMLSFLGLSGLGGWVQERVEELSEAI